MWLPSRAILVPGVYFEQTWYKSTRWCYILNIKALDILVSDKKIFKVFFSKIVFSLIDLDMQRTKIIWTISVEGHSMIICVKLFQNWTWGFGEDVI